MPNRETYHKKEFYNVQWFVEFNKASYNREDLVSGENVAKSFGKLSQWYANGKGILPINGSNGKFLGYQNGAPTWVNAIDTNVTQHLIPATASIATDKFPILLSAYHTSGSISPSQDPTDISNMVASIYAIPSTGTLYATTFNGNLSGTATYAEYLSHKTLDETGLNGTAGTFAFSGSGNPWPGTDWVGIQIGDNVDKFQIVGKDGGIAVRQNDNGGVSSTGWTDWKTLASTDGSNASGTWGISITGNAATATKLGTVSKGSPTKGIYLDAGDPKEMTYSLGSTVNGGTANCIAYYSGANAISSAVKVTYVNANNTASTPATVAGLHIESPTYGNTAANMLGGVAGEFSYGDGGPQIRFKDGSSTQAGALIFTADDAAASGTSWHFVSNETDWNVISKRFHAKTSISIGTDKPSTSYNLTVNGTSYFNNTITIKGTSSGNASIYYASYGNNRNTPSIRFYDGDVNGQGIQVGGGGLTVLGGGEAAQTIFDNLSTLGLTTSSEAAVIASDGPIYFYTNVDTGIANRKAVSINTSGYLNTGYINMATADEDNNFSSSSAIIYSNADKYLRRTTFSKLALLLQTETTVYDGHVIHQNDYNSAGFTRPVHRFIRDLRTNKLAFTLPANIAIEYSTNAGSSWTSFGYTDAQKAGPFISRHTGGSIAIGPTSGERTTSMQTRITITNDGRDCMIDQFYIWMSTSGHGTTVDIQYSTQSAKTTWVDWRTGVGLAGWAGPNVINVSELRYGNTIYSIRFIFKITSVSANYKAQSGIIYDIQAYGGMGCWGSKNNMMTHDSLFTWDYEQNATFPTNVSATKFIGPLQGNADTATTATNAYYLSDSVAPSSYRLRYINSNDVTTWTTSSLAATDSIAVIRGSVTDAWTTGHIVTFNVATVGTPFQIGVHDSSELYFYKRYKTGSTTWSGWTKMNAGYADSAGLLKYTYTNEINFSGGNQALVYFNYRDADLGTGNAVNAIEYRFCNYSNDTSKTTITAANFAGNASSASLLSHKTLNSTTINNTAGSFAFSGSGDPWAGTDWVGLQIGDNVDKWQISGTGTSLVWRQNDNGGTTSTGWSVWKTVLDSENYTSYTVTKTGTGASGTWGISITGNAATATTASKLGTSTIGSGSRPIYLNAGTPAQCDTPTSGAWWNAVPGVASNGVIEIGKYIDFHATNTTTHDYDYRITAETQMLHFAPKSSGDATYNLIRMQSPDYNQIQFQTTKTGKAYTSTGIVAYPLTTSGQTMLIQSDGNTVVGGGESPRTLYSNSYDNMDTAENETLYLASDSSEIHLITNCQAYSGRKVLKVQDGQLVKTGGLWISARDTAPVYANKPNTQDGGYYPAWFAKTKSGGWSMGVLSAQDNLYITYTSDTDYSGGSNANTYQVQFQNKSGTVALTSDIPSLSGYLPLSGGTMTGDITFTGLGNTPSSYPAKSKGIYWSGGTDSIDMYYNVRSADAGELIINMRDDANVRTSFAYNGTVKSYIDTDGIYNGNATTSSRSYALYTAGVGSSSSTHAGALQTYFEANKSTIVRNQGLGYYSSSYSNGSFYFGYFLGGYDSNPYGGFFVCHYNTPYYVGIQNGAYVQHKLLTDQNYTDFTVTRTGGGASGTWGINITGKAASADILNKNSTAGATTSGVQYVSDGLTIGTADGNAKEGSNASYKLWSYPAGGTATSSTTANIQNLRLYWNTNYFRDIFTSPNNDDIYHRAVYNGSAHPWRMLLDTINIGGHVGYGYTSKIAYDPNTGRFTSTNTSNAWDQQAYSNMGYTRNVFVTFRAGQTTMHAMIGLDSNPTQDTGYTNIDYCWYLHNDGTFQIYESGTAVSLSPNTYSTNDEFRIEYDGHTVRYYHNGALRRWKPRDISGKLYFDSCFYNAGNIYDFEFGTTDVHAALTSTGYGSNSLTYRQSNDDFGGTDGRKGNSGSNYYAHYIIANHGNGETYYHYTLRLPFWGGPQYQRKSGGSTETDSRTKWYDFITEENYSSYTLPLSGGTMSGNITFDAVTSASYPASSYGLSWSGSTDWAKIYYRVDSNDNGRLVLDIGDDLTARIDFAYNGTTKAYINYEGGATFPYLTTTYRASFATQATTDTADTQLYANGAIEIRESGRKGTDSSINSYKCAPRIGFHWGGVVGKSIAMHRDGIFYFRNQDGVSRAAAVVDLMSDYPTAVPIATLNDGCIRSFYHVNGSLTGNMPATNNAVAIIQLNRHPGDYDSQVGFSNNGNIYYRYANGSALTNSTPWVKVAFSSELDSYLPLAGGTMTGALLINTSSTSYLRLKGATAGSVVYDKANPKIRFENSDSSQNIDLIFDDYDSYQAPSSLTLIGNQGGEYFIAPNIKATSTITATKFRGVLGQKTSDSRQSTANLACTGTASMQLILSTGTMTTGKPMTDGFILDFDWDNTSGDYRGQLFVPNNGNYSMQWRGQTGSTDWSAAVAQWKTLVDSSNFKPYKSITQRLFYCSGAGWRRIMTIRSGNNNGYVMNDIKIFVRRHYNNASPESFSFHVINNYDSIKIRLLHAEQYVQLFDGIRVSKSSDSKYQYIEINYTSPNNNAVSVRYDIISPYTTDDTIEQNNPTYPADNTTLAVISDSPTPLANLLIPTGISQFNLRQVNGSYSGYFGMADATGSDSAWIRTTSQGIIPYDAGVYSTGGSCYLGTSGWYFKEAYISKVVANTIDCEGLAPRHTNEINFKSPGSTLWFGYRIITDDKGSGTTSPTTAIGTYLFGCGKANTEFASLKCKTVMLAPGTNAASYAQLTGGTLTATRTINAPDSSGTMSVSSVALTSTGTDSGYVDVPTGSRYLIVEVKIAATSVKSFHKVAIDTSITSTSLIQTTTKGQYGLQLTIQPVQFVLSGATAITGGTRYLLTMNAGSVMSISAGTTPSAASATPQIVKVYAQA